MIGLLAALAIGLHSPTPASPECGYNDVRLCDPSRVYYCPSTGQMVTWLAPCSEYSTGPHQAGMGGDE